MPFLVPFVPLLAVLAWLPTVPLFAPAEVTVLVPTLAAVSVVSLALNVNPLLVLLVIIVTVCV